MEHTHYLAAIMFTDIAGYSSLMGADEEWALKLLRKNREIQKSSIEKHRGKWLKEMGDGILAEFSSAIDAVNCGVEIQERAGKEFEGKIRIGIHLGEVTRENDDIFGDGVNIASRIESIAEPGGIFISEPIQKVIRGRKDFESIYIGEVALKNIDYDLKVYALSGNSLAVPSKKRISILTESKKKRSVFAPAFLYIFVASVLVFIGWWGWQKFISVEEHRIHSLAVLPFENLTVDSTQAYLTDGIHDNLITTLAQIGSLDVISRISTLKYRDRKGLTIPEIAKELGVEAIIETTVLKSDDSIRINVQLVQAFPNEKHLWAQIFDRPFSNILYLFDDVTQSIAREINLTLAEENSAELSIPRPIDPEAYKAYLNGQFYAANPSPDNLATALDYFERSIEIDPSFAPPYASISYEWIVRWQLRMKPGSEAVPKIYAYNQKALELDEHYPESQLIKALMSAQSEWDWQKSEEAYKEMISANPNHVLAHAFYGHLLMFEKRFDEAIFQMEEALKLDPINPFIAGLYSIVLWHKGDFEKAIDLQGRGFGRHVVAESVAYMKGDYERSFEMLEKIYGSDTTMFKDVKNEFMAEGYKAAMKTLAQTLEKNSMISVAPISALYNRAGMYDEAIRILEIGYERHDPDMPYVFVFIELNNLKSDPGFAELARKMNLPL